ncbi:MAG: hypothetical protein LBE59_02315 [Nevskiaceae bacterium]|jgi:hypothetical protein|nr:hypothetical protein [Nevskiaceae bacterium]
MRSLRSNLTIGNLAACIAALVAAPGAWAADAQPTGNNTEFGYVLRAGASYSDNLFLAPSPDDVAVGAAVAGITATGARDTGRFTYQTAVDLTYYNYFKDYDDQVFGGAALQAAYAFVPETFFWNADFNYDQVRTDLTRPMVADNLSSQTAWSTGPELHLRFGAAMEAQISGHYQAISYPGVLGDGDNSTLGGRALLLRRVNPGTQWGVGASYDDVSYDEQVVADVLDYKRDEFFVRYQSEGARSRFEAELGYSSISGDNVDDSGAMFRGAFTRRLTPTLEGSLSYSREYPTSFVGGLTANTTIPGEGFTDQTLFSALPRQQDQLEAALTMTRPRTTARLSYALRSEDPLGADVNKRDFDDVRLVVSRRFTPRATGSIFANRISERYSALAANSSQTRVGGLLTVMLGASLGLDVQIEYNDRSARQLGGSANELAGGIFLRYARIPGQSR